MFFQGCDVQIGVFFTPDGADLPCQPHRLPQALVQWTATDDVDEGICGSWLTNANWQGIISVPLVAALDGIDDGIQTRTLTVMEIHYREDEDEIIYEREISSVEVRLCC